VVLELIFQPSGSRMSVARKILAMLRWGKLYPAKRTDHGSNGTRTVELPDRRVTPRVHVHIPLFVYGHTQTGDPFHEETSTISINGPGQRLVVTNQGNDQTEQCIVVSVVAGTTDGSNIALKFPTPMPQFWRGLEIGKSHRV
jgi:hypothetical protein